MVTPAAMAARMRAASTVLLAATRRTLAGSRPTRRAACRMRSCTRATFCAIERTFSELCVSVSSIADPHHEYPHPIWCVAPLPFTPTLASPVEGEGDTLEPEQQPVCQTVSPLSRSERAGSALLSVYFLRL